jgi:predicted transposase YbfD/YdcC
MPPMMVSVWGVTMRMTFAQTEAGEGGEAEAAVKLLKSISLEGSVVTVDAIHCDRRVVETVRHRGGDYVIALNRNQRNLLASVTALFDVAGRRARSAETSETAHGRKERRSIVVVPASALASEHDFKGLARISHTTLAQFPDFVGPVGDFSGLRALAWRRLPQSSWTSSW